MEAVIYAAGRAFRLGPLGENCAKILLSFGGQTLLERHFRNLAAVGVRRVTVVTGHGRLPVAEAMVRAAESCGSVGVEVWNPDFTEGSVVSMAASIPLLREIREPVLLMDGDVLYDYRLLKGLVDSPEGTCLLIDREYSTDDDDPVLVPLRGGRPFEFLKRWSGEAEGVGESVGFFKVQPADLPLLIEETMRRAEGGRRGESYDEVIRALVRAGRFGCVDVTGLPWTEIDFPEDVIRARDEVLARLGPGPTGPTGPTRSGIADSR